MSTHTRKRALMRRTIQWVAAGAVPFVITACYGAPAGGWDSYEGSMDLDADMDSDSDSDGDTDTSVLDSDTNLDSDETLFYGIVVDVDGLSIGGIRVTCLDGDGTEMHSVLTSEMDGSFVLEAADCASVRMEDPDGMHATLDIDLSTLEVGGQEITLDPAQ